MSLSTDSLPAGIVACDCLTSFGDSSASAAALLRGEIALQLRPVLGSDGGDQVPLALIGGDMREELPPRWVRPLQQLSATIPVDAWGAARRPVIVTSSNFGVGSLHAYMRDHDPRHVRHGTPFAAVELLRAALGWGEHVHVLSHACVRPTSGSPTPRGCCTRTWRIACWCCRSIS